MFCFHNNTACLAYSVTYSVFPCVDKRSRHLGSDGVYLDDITQLEPEAAALYFPKRCVILISIAISNTNNVLFSAKPQHDQIAPFFII